MGGRASVLAWASLLVLIKPLMTSWETHADDLF